MRTLLYFVLTVTVSLFAAPLWAVACCVLAVRDVLARATAPAPSMPVAVARRAM